MWVGFHTLFARNPLFSNLFQQLFPNLTFEGYNDQTVEHLYRIWLCGFSCIWPSVTAHLADCTHRTETVENDFHSVPRKSHNGIAVGSCGGGGGIDSMYGCERTFTGVALAARDWFGPLHSGLTGNIWIGACPWAVQAEMAECDCVLQMCERNTTPQCTLQYETATTQIYTNILCIILMPREWVSVFHYCYV